MRVKRSSRETSDLEALEPIREPVPTAHTTGPPRAQSRRRAIGGLALLLSAALGSTLTIAVGHITHGSGRASVPSIATSTTTLQSNFASHDLRPSPRCEHAVAAMSHLAGSADDASIARHELATVTECSSAAEWNAAVAEYPSGPDPFNLSTYCVNARGLKLATCR